MTTYQAHFHGRQRGALGVLSNFTISVEADSKDEAVLKLYETHEHISIRSLRPVEASE